MHRHLRATVWLAALLAAAAVPPAILLAHPARPAAPPWAFAMALGYAGIAFIGLQFLLTARFKTLAAPIGIDLVYYFHRYLALGGFLLISLHAAIVAWRQPALAGIGAWPEPHVLAGIGAWLLYGVLVASSLWRLPFRLHYDAWRKLHAAAAVAAFGATGWHAWASGRYLDAPEKRLVFLFAICAWLALLLWVRVVRPAMVALKPWRVDSVRREVDRVWSVALSPVGHAGLAFEPGQFAWVTVRVSTWAMREHPFSIASSAERPERLEFTVKERGDFTRAVGSLEVGERVYVDAPYGAFSVDRHPDATGFVFVAGGIGIAPVLSCLRTLADRGDTRPVVVYYANDTADRAAHIAAIDTLRTRLHLRVVPVLLYPHDGWAGERGYVTREVLDRHLPACRRGLEFFLCGPTAMTALVERELHALGVSAWHVRTELFDLV
jgi:predicted ferric reductase